MKYKEKRVCDRKLFDEPISFQISAVEGKIKNIKKDSIAVDISSHGLGIKTQYLLVEGSVVKFHFPMKEVGTTIPVYAQVMWSMHTNDHFRVGLKFLS
jgi:hypothetical protein